MTVHRAALAVITLCLSAFALAQPADPPLVNWTAPPYWTPPTPQHVTRPQAPLAPASSRDRDVSVESTPETPLTAALPFVAVTPCRLVDTRHGPKDVQQPGGSTPGFPRGQFASGEIRSYDLTSSADCTGLPAGVGAWSLQFQFTTQGGSGVPAYLVAWPYDSGLGVGSQSAPVGESTMLGYADRWTANSAVIPAGNDAKGSINVYVQNAGDVIIEVNGYYGPQGVVTSLTGGGSTLIGDVILAEGSNVTITPSGNTLTIAATGGPGGSLPAGSSTGQTLYWNPPAWAASSALTNDGTNVGITGKLTLPNTTASAGQIKFGSNPFIHDYGIGSTFVGEQAGNFSLTGFYNTGIGFQSLFAIAGGSYNTSVGASALVADTSGADNTAVGASALASNVSASQNTAVGSGALANQSYDPGFVWLSDNTAVGYNALANTQPTTASDGNQNTAVGSQALLANTTGGGNSASGYQSLKANKDGDGNTAIGFSSLAANTKGSANIAIGYQAGDALTTGDYNIDIFNQGVAGEASTIRIGDSSYQTNTYIAGIHGVTVTGGSTVLIDSNGHLGTVVSSLRFKQGVADMGDASSRLMELRPVTFHYRTQPDGPLQYGLIAEEVEDVMPELVVRDATGQVESVAYHELPAMLLNELQKQRATIQAQIADQAKTIQAQQAQIESRDARINAFEARLAAIEARLAAK
ncbi:MAG: tail fiber domain-containing protein [Thermoanaerobaculales bacterium]